MKDVVTQLTQATPERAHCAHPIISNGHRHGLGKRPVRSTPRSHFAGQTISKGPQTKATRPPVASAPDTQPPHHSHSQTVTAPVTALFSPLSTPAKGPESGSTTGEACTCRALRELRPRGGNHPERLLPAVCRRWGMATKLGARRRTRKAFRRVRSSPLFVSSDPARMRISLCAHHQTFVARMSRLIDC